MFYDNLKKSAFYLMLLYFSGVVAGENLALNRPYDFTIKPNYEVATIGQNDDKDLTDGIFSGKEKQLWDYVESVNWVSIRRPIGITIDLGSPKNVNQVKLYTAGGSSGVNYPNIIDVEVSDDGKTFYELGCLTSLNTNPLPAPDAGYRKMTFDAVFQNVKARYVRLRAVTMGTYLCMDEIEIFGAPKSEITIAELNKSVDDDVFMQSIDRRKVENCVRRSYQMLFNEITNKNKNLTVPAALTNQIRNWTMTGPVEEFSGVYPIDGLHKQIFALNAQALQAQNIDGLAFWCADGVYDPISPVENMPKNHSVELKNAMMNHEKRLLAVNFVNGSNEAVIVKPQLQGLQGRLFEVEFIDSTSIVCTSGALREVTREFAIESGMAGQLVIELAPENLSAGTHRGELILDYDGKTGNIPISVDISPVQFPEEVTLTTGGWDHLDFNSAGISYLMDKVYLDAVLDMEKEHLVNVTFGGDNLTKATRPAELKLDGDGNLPPIDFTLFDNWIAQWPDARYYCVFMGILPHYAFAEKAERGTPLFKKLVKQWAEDWDRHIVKKNLQGRVMFHFLDEPNTEERYQTESDWSAAFRAGSKNILIFSDPLTYKAEYAKYLANSDIECPLTGMVLGNANREAELYRKRIAENKDRKFWFYRCSFGPFSTDTSYFRNQAWAAFDYGATGSMFWGFNDFGGTQNSYNQYLTRTVYFSPMLFENGKVHPTKHFKALRDGTQDFEYLTMLKDLIGKAKKQGIDTARHESMLKKCVDEVAILDHMGKISGSQSPSSLAEKNRLVILGLINELHEKIK